MGRKKVELRKIENKAYRHISFSKRKSGLLKKAYELSTLCDTEVALILFSPAGKLFLYEGKKRLEDILQQYMDLPEGQRGRLNNQKLIQVIIAQLNFEWSIYKKERLGLQDVESPLGGFHNELDFCDYELKEIEKHLTFVNERCFLRSPNVIKTVSEAENHEGILEEALARLHMQKQILEANQCFQKSLENATVGGFDMVGSSTYNFNPPTQFEPNFPPIDMPSASYEFQPCSNKPQHFAGNLQMPPTGLQGFAMDYGQTSGPDFGAYNVPQPQLGQLVNTNLPSTTDFTKDQARTSFNAVQSNFGDSTLCSLGACSHSECGHPFMF